MNTTPKDLGVDVEWRDSFYHNPSEYMRYLEKKVTELEEKHAEAYSSGYRAGWGDALVEVKNFCNKADYR